jgi:hypothetical protein
MVMAMKLGIHTGVFEKIKDRLVDGCLLYDGTICLLALSLVISVALSYGTLILN